MRVRTILITAFAVIALAVSAIVFVMPAQAVNGVTGISTAAVRSSPDYCVKFGTGQGAAGNVVENNWDSSPACPVGTYPHTLKVSDNDSALPFLPVNFFTAAGHVATTFMITDGDTTWSCAFIIDRPNPPIPVNGDIAPHIQCTRLS